jgi:hypothetical protein
VDDWIYGTVLDDPARGIHGKIIVALPVPGRPDGSCGKTSAAVWADIFEDILDAMPAKSAFK